MMSSMEFPLDLEARRTRRLGLAFGVLALVMAHALTAAAQGAAPGGGAPTATGPTAGAGPGGGAAPGGGGGSTTTTTTTNNVQYFPGGVAPTPPGGNLGGGNVEFSSSKPITGPNDRDGFDFRRGERGGSVRGASDGSFVLGEVRAGTPNSNVHVVRKGDTLWDICGAYFRNPYQWPRIWSYNPQIQNPHWIYPGDQVKLRQGAVAEQPRPQGNGPSFRQAAITPGTVFLRNVGYVEDEDSVTFGDISGSREDKMILSEGDEVYIRVVPGKELKIGQELNVFRPVKGSRAGRLVEVQGTVRVDQWNPKENLARAKIVESLDAIERGARVGPIERRFEVVPPVRNDKDINATVTASVHPHQIYAQNQVVFIDRGAEDGLKPGNRLFVLKKGDQWHKSLTTRSSARRIALESDSPAATENVPRPPSESVLPEEVQAELRVVSIRKHTAMCVVSASRREIEVGDPAFARKGY